MTQEEIKNLIYNEIKTIIIIIIKPDQENPRPIWLH